MKKYLLVLILAGCSSSAPMPQQYEIAPAGQEVSVSIVDCPTSNCYLIGAIDTTYSLETGFGGTETRAGAIDVLFAEAVAVGGDTIKIEKEVKTCVSDRSSWTLIMEFTKTDADCQDGDIMWGHVANIYKCY